MPKRTFWLVTGAALGAGSSLWAERRVRRTVQQAAARLQPDALVVEVGRTARQVAGSAGGRVRDAVASGRDEMQRREEELWADLAAQGVATDPAALAAPPVPASVAWTGRTRRTRRAAPPGGVGPAGEASTGEVPLPPGQVGFEVVTSGTAPDADHLRGAFTGFFAGRGHAPVPSASLIPHDPSVLFTIAGMVPFKPFFLGDEVPPWPRATSVQKCFRTVDIDIVGLTERHCTFFEMLGNFSFGDYFKAEAIPFAWELVTEVLGIDGDRLWVTVYESDDEAEQIWRDAVGVPADRIQRLGDDNFWKMGDTGPCGPSSRAVLRQGPRATGQTEVRPSAGSERFVEIWNLVFMQYNRSADGSIEDLPEAQHRHRCRPRADPPGHPGRATPSSPRTCSSR